ncbi:TPA: phosphoenolpyruvate synthase [Candidatus Dependentiae bacterium]|nr:MAG: Phosphoenolpyruvate synthase [candidate division TM6 bacterium GW2011_GWE2_31_21]KKP54076.1 MAG: Phosphoenolpyruvate synthase [candidate division TM6 bacterium GW2011_GWF2_33_332]HBS48342.1 phosphoenolpyruvate synthase [Candidatus Dependentiae bacterium]HBZ72984.1 phosphoenolpyruvate synthase [Candidatus Dependentiae bacterium]
MKYIIPFEDIRLKDLPIVGGKNASLGEMISALTSKGILIPSGFAITAQAYRDFIKFNLLEQKIKNLLSEIDIHDLKNFRRIGAEIRKMVAYGKIPNEIENEVIIAYEKLEKRYGKNCDVAVRSSATAEDLPEASFAGQQETFLNIHSHKNLLESCIKAFASLFTDRAIAYRIEHGFDHMSVALSIGVQKMVRSDGASSGVIFTLDTETGFHDVIFVTSSYGLGENVVQGSVNPDEFYIHKPTLKLGFKPLLKKRVGSKLFKLIYGGWWQKVVKNVSVPKCDQIKFSISDDEALYLAQQALIIEEYYSDLKGKWTPMDIEWGKDAIDGKLYILQARPETVHSLKQNATTYDEYRFEDNVRKKAKVLTAGKGVGQKIVIGKARIIKNIKDMAKLQSGEILITDMTDPDWVPIMKIAGGIITNRGGRTCHAAIVSRELGIAAIVGSANATQVIKDGQEITMDCSSGEVGYVYDGVFPFKKNTIKVAKLPEMQTKFLMNVGNPDEAFSFAQIPNDGVGLARLEFIINSSVKIHPMALVHPQKVIDKKVRDLIEELTIDYADKKQYFIDKLAQEVGTIVAAFYPKPVVVRLSDFKSNEYRQLIAGEYFEPVEENPMIGFRGASRYYHEMYKDAFVLECLAMKKVLQEMGLTNMKIMIPFVRTVNEGKKVIDLMKSYGLVQGENGLQIIMMCEIPSNVILIDEFAKVFDGFSIGSNDLTQLTLAVDRDSNLVAPIFDERNAAVKKMIQMAIEGAHKARKPIGICGQAPSDYPEIAKFLIDLKIDSISLNPDSVLKTISEIGKG